MVVFFYQIKILLNLKGLNLQKPLNLVTIKKCKKLPLLIKLNIC
jgi:hypothetical protein